MKCNVCRKIIRKKARFKRCRYCASTCHVKCGVLCCRTKKPALAQPITGNRFRKMLVGYPPQLGGLIEYGEWVDRTLDCGYELTTDVRRNIRIFDPESGQSVSVPRLVFCNKLVNPWGFPLFEMLRAEFTKRPLVLATPSPR